MTAKREKGKKAAESATVRSLHARADMKNEQIFIFLGGGLDFSSSSVEGPKRKERVGRGYAKSDFKDASFSSLLLEACVGGGSVGANVGRRGGERGKGKKASP